MKHQELSEGTGTAGIPSIFLTLGTFDTCHAFWDNNLCTLHFLCCNCVASLGLTCWRLEKQGVIVFIHTTEFSGP